MVERNETIKTKYLGGGQYGYEFTYPGIGKIKIRYPPPRMCEIIAERSCL